MTDPTPFLSTIAGASAGLVAIIGGLLVARYVGLDSEQQGADRVLAEARDRLEIARKRAQDAADRLFRFEASDFLDDNQVLNAIQTGTTKIAALRGVGSRTDLTDDQLQPLVDSLAEEFVQARTVLEEMVPAYRNVGKDELPQYMEWADFARSKHAALPESYTDGVWMRAFHEVTERRSQEHAEWKRQHPDPPKSDLDRMADMMSSAQRGWINLPASISPPTDYHAIWARRHDELRSLRDRAGQQVEDIDAEVERLDRDRERIVKPDYMLWWAVAILALFSAVGVIAPLWAMSRTPQILTPHLKALFWAFAVVFGLLVAYFIIYAWRLTRRKNDG